MNNTVKNFLVVIAGLIVGSIVNIALVNAGPYVVPLPEGADVSSREALAASMPLFSPMNFLFPFLGHAAGTLAGAFFVAKFAASHATKLAFVIGGFFLLGGIMAARMLGGPVWFIAADLVLAYIPMAWLGAVLAHSRKRQAD